MEPFKNKFNPNSIKLLSESFAYFDESFNRDSFINEACQNLASLEMKDRAVQISEAFSNQLSGTKTAKARKIKAFLMKTQLSGFILWPISIYIERHFIDDFKLGMDLLTELTKVFTSEFGVRPFLENYPLETYAYLKSKCDHKNEHVRRWITEGTRPNLPWGMNISHLNNNLSQNIELLEHLKEDSSLYVRKSVANHMSDISMINSALALKTLKRWNAKGSVHVRWIVKQALRNLIKAGNKEALSILGFKEDFAITQIKISFNPKNIRPPEDGRLKFSFQSDKDQNLMIDYILHFLKKNGTYSQKVFKLKSNQYLAGKSVLIEKKISFKSISTRTYYPGLYKIDIQVNGDLVAGTRFNLLEG